MPVAEPLLHVGRRLHGSVGHGNGDVQSRVKARRSMTVDTANSTDAREGLYDRLTNSLRGPRILSAHVRANLRLLSQPPIIDVFE